MTHFVNEKCIKCKYTDCVEVCPVDCFHEGDEMLVIDLDVCIDCGACVPECPIDAISNEETFVDGKSVAELLDIVNVVDVNKLTDRQKQIMKVIQFNDIFAKKWPVISIKKEPLADAEKFKDELDKLKYIDVY